MAAVRAIVSEAKHGEGLAKFGGTVLDVSDKNPNVPEWIRRVKTWLELNAIDGTASGLSASPYEEPKASFPRVDGPNSWIPIDPDTGERAELDEKTLEKLKGAKFVSYAAIQVNLANQARVIFQVIMHNAISKQSQAAVKNSIEWEALSEELNKWADLLNLIVRLHTVHRGSRLGESAIVAKFSFDHKIRSYKQLGSVDSGTHLERFDDLVAEGKAIGVLMDQKELAFLVVNSMRSSAARNKRNLLMDLGQNTPQSYAVAKAFVLEAEAMARSVAEFGGQLPGRGYAMTTESDAMSVSASADGEADAQGEVNLATVGGKGPRRIYTPLQKKNWKELSPESKKKVTELEALADKIRGGEDIQVDLRTVTSSLSSTVDTKADSPKKCWKCGGEHIMADCPQKDTIKGAPHAPARKFYKGKRPGTTKRTETVAVVQATYAEEDSDQEDYFYHLDNLVIRDDGASEPREKREHVHPELYFDDSEDGDGEDEKEDCLIVFDSEGDRQDFHRKLKSLKGLGSARREPTDEEITFQADLIGFPSLGKQVAKKNKWEIVDLDSIPVVKDGVFDTRSRRERNITWDQHGYRDVADPKNDYSTLGRKTTFKRQFSDDEEERAMSNAGDTDTVINGYMRETGSEKEKPDPRADNKATKSGAKEAAAKAPSPDVKAELADVNETLNRTVMELVEVKTELKATQTQASKAHIDYGRALDVVRDLAGRELEKVRGEAYKEISRLKESLEWTQRELCLREDEALGRSPNEIVGQLSRAEERNTYLISCLDKSAVELRREKEQSQFYQKIVKQQNEEIKSMHEEMSRQRDEYDERAEAYRRSYLTEKDVTESLRKTLSEIAEPRQPTSAVNSDCELERLAAELKIAEKKLQDSITKERRTEEMLKEAEEIGGAALEELENAQRIHFPDVQGVSSESRVETGGGQYEALREDADEGYETESREETLTRKRSARSGRRVKTAPKSKKTKTDNSVVDATPDKAPVFDPQTMESITPIFGKGRDLNLSGTTADEEKEQAVKRDKKLRRELAKLAPGQGIDLQDYTKRMTERHDAEQSAAEERERYRAKVAILWNCPRSVEIRERLRVTEFGHHQISEREKLYRNILVKSKEEGPEKYMQFLNGETSDSSHSPLTAEWLELEVLKWLRHPDQRPKPVKIASRERPDPIMWQRIIDARDKRAEERRRVERKTETAGENDGKTGVIGHEIAKAYSLSLVHEQQEDMPGLVDDSDAEEDDSENQSQSVDSGRESMNTKIAGETLATSSGKTTNKSEAGELTIRDPDVVTLDNAASTHIFRNDSLLHSIRNIRNGGVQIGGLKDGGEGVTCEKKGMFLSVTGVLVGKESIANLLSQGTLVDQGHRVDYDTEGDVFTVNFRGTKTTLRFERQKRAEGEGMAKHYVYKINRHAHISETVLIETIKEKQKGYSKVQLEEAAKAREQNASLNFPSIAAHLDMIEQGLIEDNTVTKEALLRSIDIWGKPVERSKGNTVYSKPTAASRTINSLPVQARREYSAHADLLFVKGIAFLIIVLDPIKYVWVYRVLSKAAEEIRKGIDRFFAEMKSYNARITCLRCDGEGGIWALESEIRVRGVLMDRAASGKHVELAERKIRQVKEGVRRAAAGLPYLLCRVLLIACVYQVVCCMNIQRTKVQIDEGIGSPYGQLTGRKINAKMHIIAPFGTYVECAVRQTDNTIAPRTDSAIYCSSALQATEANNVYLLRSGEMALRGKCEIRKMSEQMINLLDKRARKDWGDQAKDIYFGDYLDTHDEGRSEEPAASEESEGNTRITRSVTAAVGGIDNYELNEAVYYGDASSHNDEPTSREYREEEGVHEYTHSSGEDPPEHRSPDRETPGRVTFSDSAFEDRHGPAEEADYFHEWQEAAVKLDMSESPSTQAAERRETSYVNSTARGVDSPLQLQYDNLLAREIRLRKDWYHKEYALVMSQQQAIKKLGEKVALPAISKEIKQMLEKKVWTPVYPNSLTEKERKEVIRSHMFLKEKYDASGVFDKLKGRLVAGGNEQDKDNYDDLSSPTARLTSLMAVIAIAASEGRKVEAGDIPGAYLNADMKAKVRVKLNRIISSEICKIDKSYMEYLDDTGCLTVLLLKAMYGCVESAKLWNEDISKTLLEAGYEANPEDPCVFNKGSLQDEDQITVVIYVDDILATCVKQERLDDLWKTLRAKYAKPGQPDVDVKKGPIINYLGMTFDWSKPGEVSATQLGFVADLLLESGLDFSGRVITSPAAENLFDTRPDSEAGEIDKHTKDWFHRFAAKLLYLAKRTRPEILTTVAFLCTRVTKSNSDDVKKLKRVLSYLHGSKGRGIILRPGLRGMQVRVFVDAAYGVYSDFKSSSGATVRIGDLGPISANSSKQPIVAKSSMEAELIASSDMMNGPFHIKRLLIAQGYSPGPIVLYQDNLSCMALIAKGRAGSERTRHISIRYYWIKQHMDSGEVLVEKLATEEMPANILTKPLQGSQFQYERKLLTNWPED